MTSLAVSLLLHASPLVLWRMKEAMVSHAAKPETLVLELADVASDRPAPEKSSEEKSAVEKYAGALEEEDRTGRQKTAEVRFERRGTGLPRPSVARPARGNAPVTGPSLPPPPRGEPVDTPQISSSVDARSPMEGSSRSDGVAAQSWDSLPKATEGPGSNGHSPVGIGNAPHNQSKSAIRPRDRSEPPDAIRKYLALLKKQIEAHLVVPDEALAQRYSGSPVIRFTVLADGAIAAGSLSLVKSSGHLALDINAVQAAQEGVPLPRPPHPMSVVVALAFTEQTAGPEGTSERSPGTTDSLGGDHADDAL